MARKLKPHDISGAPDVVQLAEDVAKTGVARMLRRDGEELAILSPVPKRRPRRPASYRHEPASLNDWLGDLIGFGRSSGPGDVSTDIHRYVAEAIHKETGPRTPE